MGGSRWTPAMRRNMVYEVTPSPWAAAHPGHGRIRGAGAFPGGPPATEGSR